MVVLLKTMSKKNPLIEIKQILDLKDPMSKLIFTLGFMNIVLSLLTNSINLASLDMSIQQIVNILFLLYILSCFRNGDCNIFAFIISIMVVALLAAELVLRVFYKL